MGNRSERVLPSGLVLGVLALFALPSAVRAQGKSEVYQATAAVQTAGGASATVPVVITINRWSTDAQREKATGALKSGDHEAFNKVLRGQPVAGEIQMGQVKAPLHFARALDVAGGKLVTVVAPEPIYFVGAGAPGAKPKAGYDVAVALFQVDAAGKGSVGEFAPAAKLKLDANGAIEIDHYGVETVRLTDIARR